MKNFYKVLIVFGSGFLAATFGLIACWIKDLLNPLSGDNFLIINVSAFDYIFIPIIYFVFGLVLAIPLLFIDSLSISLLLSLLFSFFGAYSAISNTIKFYNRPDSYDVFSRRIFEIISVFIIFPLIGFLIWIAKKKIISKD